MDTAFGLTTSDDHHPSLGLFPLLASPTVASTPQLSPQGPAMLLHQQQQLSHLEFDDGLSVPVLGDATANNGGNGNGVLRSALFIIDTNACQREEDSPEDMILLFYPEELSDEKKHFLIGAFTSLLHFGKLFSSEDVAVATMQTARIAHRMFGPLSVFLMGTLTRTKATLIEELNLVMEAVQFFGGSADSMMKRTESDPNAMKAIFRAIQKDIAALVRHFPQFEIPAHIPYLPLPTIFNRHFLLASEIISSLRGETGNLSGCIMYSGGVVCTYLEKTTTKFILTHFNRTLKARREGEVAANTSEAFPIFLDWDKLRRLQNQPAEVQNHVHSQGQRRPGDSSKSISLHDIQVSGNQDKNGAFVGVYMIYLSHLALAVVMNLQSMYNERHVNKTRLLAHSRLVALENHLYKVIGLPQFHKASDQRRHQSNGIAVFDDCLGSMADLTDSYNGSPFHTALNAAHDIYKTTTDAVQVALGDENDSMSSRRIAGREIFFKGQQYGSDPFRLENTLSEAAVSGLYLF